MIEFTERHPIVDGPRQERFGAAEVVNRGAQLYMSAIYPESVVAYSGHKLLFTGL